MLNKRLVIAALFAAVRAQDATPTETPAATPAETPAATPATPAETPAETPAATPATPAETPAETPAATPATPATPDAGAAKEAWVEQDFDKARAAWKETIGTTELILCDQGDSKMWEKAAKQLKDAEADLVAAEAALATATTTWTPLSEAANARAADAANHKAANAPFIAAYTAANAEVNRLTTASAGTDGTSTANTALALLVAKTDAAELAVANQRQRVEQLVDALRTQENEDAAWGVRVTAATTAKNTADAAKLVATAAVTAEQENVTTRSYLMNTLALYDTTTNWSADCNTGNNAKCVLGETTVTATTSVFTWPQNCSYTTGSGLSVATKACTMLPLKKATGTAATDGLIQGLDLAIGTQRTGSAAASGYWTEVDAADWSYAAAGTTKLADALAAYKTWMTDFLLVEAMNAACFKVASANAAMTTCGKVANSAGAVGATSGFKFNPLMQSYKVGGSTASTLTQNDIVVGMASKKTAFDDASTGKQITTTLITARAAAWAKVHLAKWLKVAYVAEMAAVGDVAQKATQTTADTWKDTLIGMAEITETSKTSLATSASKDLDAATRWKVIAGEEAVSAAGDLAKARTLLNDLTDEIAPLARAETTARTAVDTAVAAQVVRDAAALELGVVANVAASTAATGARAVLAAALKTKESVEAQQAFHDSRKEWADDNLAPAAAVYNAAVGAKAMAEAAIATTRARMEAAKQACKVAAFGMAQQARETAVEVANARDAAKLAVKTKYDAQSAFPTDGSKGTLCNFPKPADGAAQEPRAQPLTCLEVDGDKPLCCGAAQRFLKDGTKLSIETCQLADATTYTYYPALPENAVVAPTPETWRFQCISAAQKLAAAATAALAAGYMMA